MNIEALPVENSIYTTPMPPAAPEPVKSGAQETEQYGRLLLALLVIAGIAVIAYVDWVVRALSLGFLYIFPLAFGAIVMGRRAAILLGTLCVFLVDWLGPYEHAGWHLLWRNVISLAGYLAVVLIVSRLAQQRRSLTETVRQQHDEMVKEIAQAALIQRRMLPQRAPLLDGIDLAARMQSAKAVAGDYYDFTELADGALGLAVADVVGKGVPAGLLTPTLKAALRLQAPRAEQSHEVAADLNQLLHDVTDEARYVTLFYGVLNPQARTLQYTNGGHLPGLWFKAATREFVWLDKGGLSLGLFEGTKYESEQVQLGRNDIIALYSDGIVEAENQRGEDFTRERLAQLIASHSTLSAEALLDAVFAAVDDFTQHRAPADDRTLLVLKVK
ncbi:MAG: PP2C family protein-serine/threonine phosphatase [Blastocatellales bacterium]